MDNIFESASFFKFTNVGDKVSGKVLQIEDSPATILPNGKEQYPAQKVFTLLKSDGTESKVGVKADRAFHMYCLHGIKTGDILFMKFESEVPNPISGYNPSKNFTIKYSRDGKNIVEPPFKWEKGAKHLPSEFDVKAQPRMEVVHQVSAIAAQIKPLGPGYMAESTVEEVQAQPPFESTPENKLARILDIASKKFGITDAVSIKDKVMEETQVAFIPSNYDEIIDKLEQF